jgi:hypothetical protein
MGDLSPDPTAATLLEDSLQLAEQVRAVRSDLIPAPPKSDDQSHKKMLEEADIRKIVDILLVRC